MWTLELQGHSEPHLWLQILSYAAAPMRACILPVYSYSRGTALECPGPKQRAPQNLNSNLCSSPIEHGCSRLLKWLLRVFFFFFKSSFMEGAKASRRQAALNFGFAASGFMRTATLNSWSYRLHRLYVYYTIDCKCTMHLILGLQCGGGTADMYILVIRCFLVPETLK